MIRRRLDRRAVSLSAWPRVRSGGTCCRAAAEALLAVDLYNRAASERSLEGFVMHMHVAWLYMLHARFTRDAVDYAYRQPNGRFVRVDGEVKTWELARCLREAFADESNSVRCNVEFFIKVRNKIEHRYEQLLAVALAGKTQAHVLNYEETLTGWFGPEESLGDSLRFPVFMSSLTPDAVKALKQVHRKLPKRITAFIREHDAALPSRVQRTGATTSGCCCCHRRAPRRKPTP